MSTSARDQHDATASAPERNLAVSTTSPESFRSYLTEAHAVRGPDIPDRPPYAQFIETCHQDGVADAERGIFDKHSFALQAPTTFEHRCSSWLDVAFSKAIDERHDDLHTARDIMARTEAACAQVEGQRHQTEQELTEVEQEIEKTRAVLRDPGHALHEPLADMLSSPEPIDTTETNRRRKAATPRFRTGRRVGSWLGRRPWATILLWPFLVAGEIGLIYQITQEIGDGVWTGLLLTVSLSAFAVAIAWLAVPPLVQAGASRARQVLSAIALLLYLVGMVALGWLRYLKSRPEVVTLMDDAADSSTAVAVFPWFGAVLLFLLWVALPLGLTAVIALLHIRHSIAEHHDDPVDTEADPAGTSSDEAGAKTADRAAGGSAVEVDLRVRHQQDQLIAHLRALRLRRIQLQDQLTLLRAEVVYARAALDNARLNEDVIDERARLHLQSLPQTIGDGFLSYLKGLEQGLGDPTMTAYLQEVAEAFLSRYTETAEAKVNGFLVYLDEHPLSPTVLAAATEAA